MTYKCTSTNKIRRYVPMKMKETIEFILKNKDALNPAVLKAVLESIEPEEDESEEDPTPAEEPAVEPEEEPIEEPGDGKKE